MQWRYSSIKQNTLYAEHLVQVMMLYEIWYYADTASWFTLLHLDILESISKK